MQITYADFFVFEETQGRLQKSGLESHELSAVCHALESLSGFFSVRRNQGRAVEQEVSFLGYWEGSRHDLVELLKVTFIHLNVTTSAPDGRFTISFSPKKEVWTQYARSREVWAACRSPAVQATS